MSANNVIKISGPGPAIAGGAGLVILGGALAYKTQTDDMNPYRTDGMVTGIGVGLMAAGVVAIAYGAYQLSVENEK